ncbi:hypothetical protein MgSA37_02109 [Mucilaginibacter gotjawali]|uniref:Uncharacterized protein n=2 Tax=Mucilaginibacter gotjawali TaxID=1550579 RepID=A0A110B5C0_9SPHI|nr:hypothetical protein [Mucilaginibacter gotjawali]BAU53938.1 hypothetical protein MgSA37_02109 [Mucilaginibacter gotjawali]
MSILDIICTNINCNMLGAQPDQFRAIINPGTLLAKLCFGKYGFEHNFSWKRLIAGKVPCLSKE